MCENRDRHRCSASLAIAVLVAALFASLAACQSDPGEVAEQTACRAAVNVGPDFPTALQYATVPVGQNCPTATIEAARQALLARARSLCAEGECESLRCQPSQTTALAINRQIGSFPRETPEARECWIVIEAEYSTECVCRE